MHKFCCQSRVINCTVEDIGAACALPKSVERRHSASVVFVLVKAWLIDKNMMVKVDRYYSVQMRIFQGGGILLA